MGRKKKSITNNFAQPIKLTANWPVNLMTPAITEDMVDKACDDLVRDLPQLDKIAGFKGLITLIQFRGQQMINETFDAFRVGDQQLDAKGRLNVAELDGLKAVLEIIELNRSDSETDILNQGERTTQLDGIY